MLKKIIVIDDEEDVLRITKAALTTRNYDVITTTSGAEGVELIASEKPDLIICDLMMPRVSGLEVLKRIRQNKDLAKIPVMVLSALGTDERPPEFWVKTLGVDDYIQKPFDPLDLLGRVEYLFRKKTYISSRPGIIAGSLASESAARPMRSSAEGDENATKSPMDVEQIPPPNVVRAFVESYNRQDFATEYNCLDEEMTGGMNLHDYVNRRRQTFIDEKQQDREQHVLSIEEVKISLNVAKVVIIREDIVRGTPKQKKETYTLKKTYKGWKIIGCRVAKA